MTWQNPWAWIGIAAAALPIFIHLLAKHRARTLKFPTLRFIHATAVVPTRRTRLTDPLLLLVRIAIITCAVAALAQPLFATSHRARTVGRGVARAVVVDTSESMLRMAIGTTSAHDRALQVADSLTSGAATAVIARTTDPLVEIAGAAAWLQMQNGQRNLDIVSDFQAGALDSSAIARIPGDITVRLYRVPVDSMTTPGSQTLGPPTQNEPNALTLLAPSGEEALARATMQAAIADGAPPLAPHSFDIAIVFPRTAPGRRARATMSPALIDIASRIRQDEQLIAAASISTVEAVDTGSADCIALARDLRGTPIAYASADSINARERLLVLSSAEPGTLASAALVAATLRAAHNAPSLLEREPAVIPDAVLRTWERNATSAGPRADHHSDDTSDGRWIWLAALALLAIESWLRTERADNAVVSADEAHERAA